MIKSSTELRDNYKSISEFCHNNWEAVYITENGSDDLALMSVPMYEDLVSRVELYKLLAEGQKDIAEGRTQPFREAMQEIRAELKVAASA